MLEREDNSAVYVIARKNGQAGVIKNGKVIVNFAYQNIEYDDYNQVFVLERSSKMGIAGIDGSQIIPVEYEQININGIYFEAVAFDGNVTYFDAKGVKQEDTKYESILKTGNENYFITIDKDGKYGIIDGEGQLVLENTYQYLEYIYEDYFIASNDNGNLGIINKSGDIVVEFKYEVLQKVDNSNIVEAKILKQNITELYSSKLEKIYTNKNVSIYGYEDHIEVSSGDEIIYFDMQGNKTEDVQISNTKQPQQIGPYHKVYYGYGECYYTSQEEE